MKRKLLISLLILYVIIAAISTKALLDRNEHGVFELTNNYYICSEKIKEYDSSSLVRFAKNVDFEKYVEEEVYYFNKDNELKYNKIESFDKDKGVVTIDGDNYAKGFVLGKPDKAYKIVGSILNFITSSSVYLVFVIIPILILFIYEIYLLVDNAANDKKEKENDKDDKNTKKKNK